MSDEYIHGYSAAEMRRLTRMQDILNDAELAALDLRGVRRLLDVGSGLGQMSRALARTLGPERRVVGVERDAQQRSAAELQAAQAGETGLVEFRAGEATELPLTPDERGSFDLAHARFLLEHVRDPLAAVREMVAAVRPGGRLVLVDDDHELLQLWPDCPEAARAWRVYWESYRDRGLDPLVGRRLAGLLQEGGATPTRVTTVFYGACRGTPLFDRVVDNLVGVLDGAREGLERSGRLPGAALDAAIAALAGWRRLPAATLWYSLPLAEGMREA
jgi:ubiquinone/menaquinone biosynthesis C-methylase UbiE